MNVKTGDLAVCIRSPNFPELVGRIFTITSRCVVYEDSWNTDPPQFVYGYTHPVSFSDETLRPLNGGEGVDETLRISGLPVVV